MKPILSLFIASLIIPNVSWAAKFESISGLTSKRLEALAKIAKRIQKNEEAFGDVSATGRYRFTRNDDEEDVNTLEQLNVAKYGVFHDDDPKVTRVGLQTAKEVIETLFENITQDVTHEKATTAAQKELVAALKKVMQSTYLEVWEADHANEDGSWKILDVLDPRNNEILVIRFGYHGT